MKTILIVYEAAAEAGLAELDGSSPLQVARMHHASRLAVSGSCGVVKSGGGANPWPPARVLGRMCGVDAQTVSSWRRGPVEAAGVADWPDVGWVYRGDLVAVDGDVLRASRVDGLTGEETGELVGALAAGLADEPVRLAMTGPGTMAVGFRGVGGDVAEGLPPFGVEGDRWAPHRLTGKGGQVGRRLMDRAAEILASHTVNDVRVDLGENPANGLWLWGGGARIDPQTVATPLSGHSAVLTGSLVGAGLAALSGMDHLPLQSPWKEVIWQGALPMRDLVELLRERDRLVVFLEAPRGGGAYGSGVDKTRALDHLDQSLLGPLLEVLDAYRPFRVILMTNSAVSTETGLPLDVPLPVVVCGDGIAADEVTRWDEDACVGGALGRMNLEDFLETLRKQNIWP